MFLSGREKEQETLEGDNLFTSEASSAAFFFSFSLGFESGRSRPSRGTQESPRRRRSQWNHSENSQAEFNSVSGVLEAHYGHLRQQVSVGGLVDTYWILQNWWRFRVCWIAAESPLVFISRDILNVWETTCIEFPCTHSRRSLLGKWFPRTILQVQKKIQRRRNDYCHRKQDASSQDSISWHSLWVCSFSHFLFPSAHSHAINFTFLSIRKSSSFHAMTCFFSLSLAACGVFSREERLLFQHSTQASVPPLPHSNLK